MKVSIKKVALLGISVAAFSLISGCQKSKIPTESETSVDGLSSLQQKVMYLKSYKMIKTGMANGAEFDEDVMARAIYDAQNGIPSKIPKSEEAAVMMQLKRDVDSKTAIINRDKAVATANKNAKDGAFYLTENAKKEGVTVTDSGLQYRVLTAVEGDAPKPKPENGIVAHYKGNLIDGEVFKNTFTGPKPAKFLLSDMIPGWIEGIQLMKVGEKFEFVVPSYLAYGEEGRGTGPIGANATLVFEIELFDVELLATEAGQE